ncbi:MAG TPA: GAF domain-containing protein [Cyclobacteriaceae bacterium]|nr:GAF domain-containing protein [Cyclobacteriaceae bacterium]
MILQLKNSQRLSLFLAMIFFLAMLASAYMLYSLPSDVIENAGYASLLTRTYLVVGATFILGAIAIFYTISSKKELVVFKEKTTESEQADSSSLSGSKSTISLESVQASLSGDKSREEIFKDFLHAVCRALDAGQGALYEAREEDGKRKVELTSGYALNLGESASIEYEFGEGLIGQAALGGRTLYLDDIPEGYIKIVSGLGSSSPRHLLIVPVKSHNEILGVMEIASFSELSEDKRKFVEEATQLLEKVVK